MSTQRITMAGAGEPQGAARRTAPRGGRFLTFVLGEVEHGLEIQRVGEIIGRTTITPIPRTEAFVRGVINLRGKVIPVIDLRLRLGMESVASTEETCIIVVKDKGAPIGIVVDEVTEVCDIAPGRIEQTPALGAGIDTGFILGIGTSSDGRVKRLLDIDRVLATGEAASVQAAAAELTDPVGA